MLVTISVYRGSFVEMQQILSVSAQSRRAEQIIRENVGFTRNKLHHVI